MGKIELCNTNELYFRIYSRNDGYWVIVCIRHNPNCEICPLKQLNCLYDGDSDKIAKPKKNIKK